MPTSLYWSAKKFLWDSRKLCQCRKMPYLHLSFSWSSCWAKFQPLLTFGFALYRFHCISRLIPCTANSWYLYLLSCFHKFYYAYLHNGRKIIWHAAGWLFDIWMINQLCWHVCGKKTPLCMAGTLCWAKNMTVWQNRNKSCWFCMGGMFFLIRDFVDIFCKFLFFQVSLHSSTSFSL